VSDENISCPAHDNSTLHYVPVGYA